MMHLKLVPYNRSHASPSITHIFFLFFGLRASKFLGCGVTEELHVSVPVLFPHTPNVRRLEVEARHHLGELVDPLVERVPG